MAAMRKLLAAGMMSCMGGVPLAVHGQTKEETDVQYLAPVSVTATRNPIKAFDYPGMVTVIDQGEIEDGQASTPDDLLKMVPNLEFTGGPRRSGEVPSIRGFSGPDVIVLFDGARQNFGAAHDGRFFIDPGMLKQVEVLCGPASALYGSGGTGGVIEFRTKDAADFLQPGEWIGGSASLGYQTANRERHATFTSYGRTADNLDVIGSVVKRLSGSIELGDGNKLDQSDDDILSGLAKVSYRAADYHRIEGSFLTFNSDAEEPNNPQGAGSTDIVDREVTSNTVRAAYNYRNPANPWLDLDVVTYYTATQNDEVRLDNNGAGPAGQRLRRDVDTTGARVDNRSRIMLSDSVGATLTYGGGFYHDKQDGDADGAPLAGVPDAKADALGVFAQAEIVVADAFGVVPGDILIIPGVRFDDYEASSSLASGNSDSAVSPRIGVSYLPKEWLLLFANYSHAFRAPDFDETYLTGTHFQIPLGAATVVNRFVPNPDLKPQRTRTFEFGSGLTFNDAFMKGDILQAKFSRFIVDGEDFIDLSVNQPTLFVDCNPFIPGACDGTTNSTNVPNAKLWGNEFELSYENRRMLLALGYSDINGKNEDTGLRLGVLTPDQYTMHAAVKLPEFDTVIGWRLLLAGKFDKVNAVADERSGYDVHDFYVSWQPRQVPLQGLRLTLGVDNAFDENYARVYTGAAEQGRNYKATVRYTMNW